jgi:hypothetical protein
MLFGRREMRPVDLTAGPLLWGWLLAAKLGEDGAARGIPQS